VRFPAVLTLVVLSAALLFATADGAWLARVPASDHQKINPYKSQPEALAAGRNIFEEHCTKCHGQNAEGVKKHPSLRTARIQQQATEGDLHWLLVNGSMKKGMPSWAKLPDPQLWQLVTYLKSLHE
jgi:mono/diheme cytochrome c family protein